MGTTAEKLAYLKQSKNQIKTALETPSNVMREYSNWIKKYVQNQPTNTVTDGVCKNALNVPLVSLGVDGNSEQKTYEGKNLASNIYKEYNTTDGNYSYKKIIENFTKPYLVASVYDNDTSVDLTGLYFGFSYNGKDFINDGDWIVQNGVVNDRNKRTDAFKYLSFYPKSKETLDKIFKRYKIQIELSDTWTSTPYEPYTGGQPSPNPEYRQDIEDIDGVNIFDKDNDEKYNSYINKATGELATENISLTVSKKIEKYAGKSITISKILTDRFRYAFYSSNIFNSDTLINNVVELSSNLTDISVIVPNNAKYVNIQLKASNVYSEDDCLNSLQITEGATPKPYLPHGHIGLEQRGVNEFDEEYLSGYYDSNGIFKSATNQLCTKNFIEVKPNSTYWLGIKHDWAERKTICLYDKYKNFIERIVTGEYAGYGIFYTVNANTCYIKVNFSSAYGTTYNNDIIIAESDVEVSYEPYHEPKLIPINLNGNSIAKVGDVKDLLKIYRNGDVEIEKKIGEVVLDGSDDEEWQISTALHDNFTRFIINAPAIAGQNKAISTYFKIGDTSSTSVINVLEYRDTNKILINTNVASSVNTFKSWLSAHNIILKYQLAEPETIKLPSIEPITLWEGTNKFELITNLDTTFEMEYVVNKNNILDEIQTAMLEAEIEI